MQDCRQWVKSRMEDRGAKPFEFSQTAPPHKPSDSVSNTTFSGSSRNPQTVSFLELLDLPYVLDNALDSRDTPVSLPQKDDYSEDIPIEDEDDLEDAEPNNENRTRFDSFIVRVSFFTCLNRATCCTYSRLGYPALQ
ncbi:hypothetical protein Goklo_025329, partial [Gossypium klotzschianum]|nr:hypothetical protein [Gossypium klotzschianum]